MITMTAPLSRINQSKNLELPILCFEVILAARAMCKTVLRLSAVKETYDVRGILCNFCDLRRRARDVGAVDVSCVLRKRSA